MSHTNALRQRPFANAKVARHGDTVADDDREADDALAPKRRGRLLLPLLVLLLGVPLGVLVGRALKPAPAPPPPPPPVAIAPVDKPAPPPVVAPPPPAPPPPTIVKEPKSPPKRPAEPPKAKTATMTFSGVTGNTALRAPLERGLKTKLASVTVPEGQASYSVTVNVAASGGTDDVTVRCNASIAALPKKTIVASLKSRADVAGENTPREELEDTATETCAKSLADDLKGWLRANPP